MVSFSQLPAVKKETIFGATKNFFDPTYFVPALFTVCKPRFEIFLLPLGSAIKRSVNLMLK